MYVVHNKNAWQLTHLLEYGHATRDGGRYEGIKHIEPNEKETIQSIAKMVEEVINNAN